MVNKLLKNLLLLSIPSVFLIACSPQPNSSEKNETVIHQEQAASLDIISGNGEFGEQTGVLIKTIILRNIGTSPSELISAQITGLNSSDFSIIYQSGCGVISVGGRCTLKITFDGRNKPAGNYQASLDLSSYLQIPLSASVPQPPPPENSGNEGYSVLVSSQESKDGIDFGSLTGNQSVIKTIYIRNVGTSATPVSTATVSSPDYSLFYNQCQNKSLGPGRQCMIKISFSSSGKSPQVYNANLIFDSLETPLMAEVTGPSGGTTTGGVITPEISLLDGVSLALDPIDFGSFLDGQSIQKILYIKNTGTVDIPSLTAELTGPNAVDYTMVYNQCVNRPLRVNNACQIRLSFVGTGKTAGIYTAQISVPSLSYTHGVTALVLNNYSLAVAKRLDGIRSTTVGDLTDGEKIACLEGCSTGSALYAEGSNVTLQYTAPPGYEIVSWGGDCSSSGSNSVCQLTMDSNKSVEINITQVPLPSNLSLVINDGDLYTNEPSVNLQLLADNALEMKISENDNCSGGDWESYNSSKILNLTALNSSVNISFMARNLGGESSCVGGSITHDDINPLIEFPYSSDQFVQLGQHDFQFSVQEVNSSNNVLVEEFPQAGCSGTSTAHNFSAGGNLLVNLDLGQTKSIKVSSEDLAGNLTEVCSYNVTFLDKNQLTVTLEGEGDFSTTVSDDLSVLLPLNSTTYSGGYDNVLVEISAAIGANDVFTGWSGDCSGVNLTCSLDMATGNKTVQVNLEQKVLEISPLTSQYTIKSHSVKDTTIDSNWIQSKDYSLEPVAKVQIGSVVYFAGPDVNTSLALWKTEGTLETTEKVSETLDLYGTMFLSLNDKLYFYAKHPAVGMELFYFDPSNSVVEAATSSTPLCSSGYNPCVIKEINPGSGNGVVFTSNSFLKKGSLETINNRVIFHGWEGQPDPSHVTWNQASIWSYNPGAALNTSTVSCSSGGNPCRLSHYTDYPLSRTATSNNNNGINNFYRENNRLIYELKQTNTSFTQTIMVTDGTASGTYSFGQRQYNNETGVYSGQIYNFYPLFVALRGNTLYLLERDTTNGIYKHFTARTLPSGAITHFPISTFNPVYQQVTAATEIPGDNRALLTFGDNNGPLTFRMFNGLTHSVLSLGSAFGFGVSSNETASNIKSYGDRVNLTNYMNFFTYTYDGTNNSYKHWSYNPNQSTSSTANNTCEQGANPCVVAFGNPPSALANKLDSTNGRTYVKGSHWQLPITESSLNSLYSYNVGTGQQNYVELIPRSDENMDFCILENGSSQLVTIYNKPRVEQVLFLLGSNIDSSFSNNCSTVAGLVMNDNNYNITYVANNKPISGVSNTGVTGRVETHSVNIGYEIQGLLGLDINGRELAIVSKRLLTREGAIFPSLCIDGFADCQISDHLGSKIISFFDNASYDQSIPQNPLNIFNYNYGAFFLDSTTNTFTMTVNFQTNIQAQGYVTLTHVLTQQLMGPYPITYTNLGTSHSVAIPGLPRNNLYEVRATAVSPDGWFFQTNPSSIRTPR